MSELLERIIIQAPMGGGPGTPALAAAVSNAGGIGSLAGAYLTPEQITADIAATRALTRGPINVNLFAGGYHTTVDRDPAPMLELLAEVHRTLELPPPSLPNVPPDPFDAQLEVVLRAKPEIFSFTFGIPSDEAMRALRGIYVIGTATTVAEAQLLADAGVDAIVAQGAEAGAHRGTFAAPVEQSMIPTLELVRGIAARVKPPVIASGGIMTGAEIRTALDAGASAVQLGTAFLLCPEAGSSQPYRDAVLRARGTETELTRAFSGRAARGIHNRFMELVPESAILPFPIQNTLTRAMRAASAKANNAEYLSLWAGTGVERIRALPAGELVKVLMAEMVSAR
ncbi:MAG TPA: nitronate monooxygenase [Thermoanaerobaculia bacterium]|nr:nitronate monooxygenase [Thermoanaerobaculia bacterium]